MATRQFIPQMLNCVCVVDIARDTSDTDAADSDATDASDVEYEPVTEPEDDGPLDDDDTSANSDNDIIATKVIEVSVGDDGSLQFADSERSERTDSYTSDSEMDLFDYWNCAQCRAKNNNPLYRYCHKCFQVRKNFFPPRPRRKRHIITKTNEIPRTLSQDSGVDSPMSQETDVPASQDVFTPSQDLEQTSQETDPILGEGTSNPKPGNSISSYRKRRAESADRRTKRKRARTDSDTDLDSDDDLFDHKTKIDVRPLVKTVSDPAITVEKPPVVTKKVIANTLIEKMEEKDLCMICISEPKSGVFVHGRIAHICCCYKCAVKVWAKAKRCPVCNCKVSNVLKAVVM